MTLNEKAAILESVLLSFDVNEKRIIERNLSRKYSDLLAKPQIFVVKILQSLYKKDVFITADQLWFFMKIAAACKFRKGTYTYGKAVHVLVKKYETIERRFEVVINQKSMEKEYSRKLLLGQIKMIEKENIHLELSQLYKDLMCWSHPDRYVQEKWVSDFVDPKEQIESNEHE